MHKFSIVCDYIHNALINIEAPTPPPHPIVKLCEPSFWENSCAVVLVFYTLVNEYVFVTIFWMAPYLIPLEFLPMNIVENVYDSLHTKILGS